MKKNIKLFFSMCIAINMILITTIFILNRSIDYAELKSVQVSNGKTHISIEDVSNKDIEKISDNYKVDTLSEKKFFDGNKSLEDKALTVIGTNKDFFKANDTSFIKGREAKNDNEIVLEKWVYENLKHYIHDDKIELDLLEHGKKTFKIAGVISDIKLNKDLGKIEIYKKISDKGPRSIALILSDSNEKRNEIDKIKKEFKDKDISVNNALLEAEDKMKILSVDTLLLCFSFLLLIYISVKGIYYISIKSKLQTYGILRALGIKKTDIFKRIFNEIFIGAILPAIAGILIGCSLSIIMKGIIKKLYEFSSFDILIDLKLLIIILPLVLGLLILTTENYIRIIKYSIVDLINYETDGSSSNTKMGLSYCKSENIIKKLAINNILQNRFKNSVIFLSLSIISAILAATSFYYGMENIVYNQEAKHSGSGYNYTIEAYPFGGKTYTGLSAMDLNKIKNIKINDKKAVEDIETFKIVNGRVLVDKSGIFDWKYIQEFTAEDSENKYFKEILKWVGRENNGKYEVRSNLIGVDDSYIDKIKNSIEDFDIEAFKEGRGAILYDPLHQEKYEGIIKNNSYKNDLIFKYPKNFSEQLGKSLDENGNEKQATEFKNKEVSIIGRTNDLNISCNSYVGIETLNLIVSNKYIDKYIGMDKYKIVKLDAYKNVSDLKLKEKLLEITKNNPAVNVLDNKEDIVKAKVYYDSKQKIFIGFALMLLVIFSLNLFNSMIYRISLRKREYVFIKNIGATARQIRNTLMTEGFATGVIIAIITLILTLAIQAFIYNYYTGIMLEKECYNNVLIILFIMTVNVVIGLTSSAIGIKNEKL